MPILPAEPMIYPANLLDVEPLSSEADPPPSAATKPSEPALAGSRWFVAHTRPRQEKALARYLFSRGIAYFLPQSAHMPQLHRHRESWIPIFTGYLFLRTSVTGTLDAMKSNRIAALLRVPDQARLQTDLQRVKRLIEARLPLYPEQRLLPGRPVRLVAGPLMGLTGIIESRPGPCRFVVAVDFIGQGVSVEVDARSIEPLEGEPDSRTAERHPRRLATGVQ